MVLCGVETAWSIFGTDTPDRMVVARTKSLAWSRIVWGMSGDMLLLLLPPLSEESCWSVRDRGREAGDDCGREEGVRESRFFMGPLGMFGSGQGAS